MRRLLPFIILALALVAASAPAKDPAAPSSVGKKGDQFSSRVLALTDLVMQRHIDPPTRQQMILHGTRAVYRAAGEAVPQSTSRQVSGLATSAQLAEFLNGLKKRYGTKARTEEVFIQGVLASIPGGARIITGEELKVQDQLNANRYVGTGIVLSMDRESRRPAILKPFFNGPAWKAGAKAGDVFLEVDGRNTEKMTVLDVVRLLRGKRASVVIVKVRQPKSADVRTLTITRDVAFIPTVEGHQEVSPGKWQYRIDSAKHVAYLRLNRIGSSTLHELRQVDARLRDKGVRGIVLDLRYGGGTLHDIVLVADALLDGGVIGRVRNADGVKTHNSTRGMLFAKHSMAVLVDGSSSSGNEFLAAALQDNRRGVIVGEPTPGDGFVRSYVSLPGQDGAIVMAIGELQRGDGTPLRAFGPPRPDLAPIAKHAPGRRPGGIIPDHRVTIAERDRHALIQAYSYTIPGLRKPVADPVLAKAVEILNARANAVGSKSKSTSKKDG